MISAEGFNEKLLIREIKEKYGDFLGEFKLLIEHEQYDCGRRICLACLDGRNFYSDEIYKYGFVALDSPYKEYEEKQMMMIKSLLERVEKATMEGGIKDE